MPEKKTTAPSTVGMPRVTFGVIQILSMTINNEAHRHDAEEAASPT
jgi:hypothetical protein